MVGWTESTRRAKSDFFSTYDLVNGEEIYPRFLVNGYVSSSDSSNLAADIFTARKTELINNLHLLTGSVAAGATPTLVRTGVYEWDDDLDQGTLIHSSVNNTSLFSATFTEYAIPLSTAWNKVKGRRYGLALIIVTAAALPNFQGYSRPGTGNIGNVLNLAPQVKALTATADLTATMAGNDPGGNTWTHYWRMS